MNQLRKTSYERLLLFSYEIRICAFTENQITTRVHEQPVVLCLNKMFATLFQINVWKPELFHATLLLSWKHSFVSVCSQIVQRSSTNSFKLIILAHSKVLKNRKKCHVIRESFIVLIVDLERIMTNFFKLQQKLRVWLLKSYELFFRRHSGSTKLGTFREISPKTGTTLRQETW